MDLPQLTHNSSSNTTFVPSGADVVFDNEQSRIVLCYMVSHAIAKVI